MGGGNEIRIPVKLEVLQDSITQIKSVLSNLKPESSAWRELSKILQGMEKEARSLEVAFSKPFSSQAQFTATEKGINKIEDALTRAKMTMSSIKFSDIQLTAGQKGALDDLQKEINSIKSEVTNFKAEIKQSLQGQDIWSDIENLDPSALAHSFDDIVKAVSSKVNAYQRELERAKIAYQNFEETALKADTTKKFFEAKNGPMSVESLGQEVYNQFFKSNGTFKGGQQDAFYQWMEKNLTLTPEQLEQLKNKNSNELKKAFADFDVSKILEKANKDSAKGQELRDSSSLKTEQFEAARRVLEALGIELNAVSEKEASLADRTADVARRTEEAKQAIVEDTREKAKNTLETNKLAMATEQLKRALEQANEKYLKQQRVLSSFSAMKTAIVNFMGFTQVVNLTKQAITSALNHIKELDTVMNNISIVTDMSTSDLWSQVDAYSKMAQTYGVSIKGAYEVSQIYYQQGLKTNDVLTLTNETLKLAKISGLDYGVTTDYMTTALRGFKMEMSDAGKVVDVYSNLAAHTAVTQEELAVAMSKTASSMESVGSTFEETSAMIGTMVAVTRESATNIGSALKSIAARYGEMKQDPLKLVDSEGDEMSFNKVDAALQSVGISMKTADGQFRSFTEVIVELSEKWDQLESTQQRYIATQFAGNRQQSRFLALVSNKDLLSANIKYAEESEETGTLQALKALDSVESKIEQVKVAYQQFYTTVGGENVWKGALDGLRNYIDYLNSLPKLFGKLPVSALTMVSNLLGVLKLMGEKTIGWIAKFISSGLKKAGDSSGDFSNNILPKLQKQTEEFGTVGEQQGKAYIEGFAKGIGAAEDLGAKAKDAIAQSNVKNAVEAATTVNQVGPSPVEANTLSDSLYKTSFSKEAYANFQTLDLSNIQKSSEEFSKMMVSAVQSNEEIKAVFAQAAKDDIEAYFTELMAHGGDVTPAIESISQQTAASIQVNEWLTSNFEGLDASSGIEAFNAIINNTDNGLAQLKQQFQAVGPDIAQRLILGLITSGGEVTDEAIKLAQSIYESIQTTLDIHSPSPLIIGLIATGVGGGLKQGLAQAAVDGIATIEETWPQLIEAMNQAIEDGDISFDGLISEMEQKITEFAGKSKEEIAAQFGTDFAERAQINANKAVGNVFNRKGEHAYGYAGQKGISEEERQNRLAIAADYYKEYERYYKGEKNAPITASALKAAFSREFGEVYNLEGELSAEKRRRSDSRESFTRLQEDFISNAKNGRKEEQQPFLEAQHDFDKTIRQAAWLKKLGIPTEVKPDIPQAKEAVEAIQEITEEATKEPSASSTDAIEEKIQKEEELAEAANEAAEAVSAVGEAEQSEQSDAISARVEGLKKFYNQDQLQKMFGGKTNEELQTLAESQAPEGMADIAERDFEAYKRIRDEITPIEIEVIPPDAQSTAEAVKESGEQAKSQEIEKQAVEQKELAQAAEEVSSSAQQAASSLEQESQKDNTDKPQQAQRDLQNELDKTSKSADKAGTSLENAGKKGGSNIEETGNKWKKTAGSWMRSTGMVTSTIVGFLDQTTKSGGEAAAAITGIGGAINLIGSIMSKAGPFAYITAALTIITSIVSFIQNNSLEKQLERATKKAEQLQTAAKEAKANYNTLDNSAKKLDELKEKRYESAESAQEYQTAVDELTQKFPQLIESFDDSGNAILDEIKMTEALTKTRKESAEAALEAAKAELERAKTALKKDIGDSKELKIDRSSYNEEELGADYLRENVFNTNIDNPYKWLTQLYSTVTGVSSDEISAHLPNYKGYADVLGSFFNELFAENKDYSSLEDSEKDFLNKYKDVYTIGSDTTGKLGELWSTLKSEAESVNAERMTDEERSLLDLLNNLFDNENSQYLDNLEDAVNTYNAALKEYQSDSSQTNLDALKSARTALIEVTDSIYESGDVFIKEFVLQYSDELQQIGIDINKFYDDIAAINTAKKERINSTVRAAFSDKQFIIDESGLTSIITNKISSMTENVDDINTWLSVNADQINALVTEADTLWSQVIDRYDNNNELASANLTKMLNAPGKYTYKDIVSYLETLGITLDGQIADYLKARSEQNSETIKQALSDNINTLRGERKTSVLNDLQTFIEQRNELFTNYDRNYFNTVAGQINSLEKQGFNAQDFYNYATALYSQIYSDVNDATRYVLMDAISKNGLKTEEGIQKVKDAAISSGVASESNLITSLTSLQELVGTNIALSVATAKEDFISSWGDSSKELKKITSGIDFTEMQDMINLSSSFENFTLSQKDFRSNGDKLVLTAQKAQDYWDAYEAYMLQKTTTWNTKLEDAASQLSGISKDNFGETIFTEDMTDNLSEINSSNIEQLKLVLGSSFDTYISTIEENDVNTYKWKDIVNGEKVDIIKVLNEAYENTKDSIKEYEDLIAYAGEQIIKESQWNKGDYSSLKDIYESELYKGYDYMSRLHELVAGAAYEDWELDYPDIKNAVDKMSGVYGNLLSDILDKGIDKINLNQYEGLDEEVKQIVQSCIDDENASLEKLIIDLSNRVGKSVSEINEIIVQQMQKEVNLQSTDIIKDLTFISDKQATTTLAGVEALANALNMYVNDFINLFVDKEHLAKVPGEYLIDTVLLEAMTDIDFDTQSFKDTIADNVREFFEKIANLVKNGLSGSLSNADKTTLTDYARDYLKLDNLQFEETASGFKLTTKSAWDYYNALKTVDDLRAAEMFKELSENLIETDSRFKTVSSQAAYFAETQRKIRQQEYMQSLESGSQISDLFTFTGMAGNVDLNNRPKIKNLDGTISTLLTQTLDSRNFETDIPWVMNVTPITSDGQLLSDEYVTEYIQSLIDNTDGSLGEILAADEEDLGLIIELVDATEADQEALAQSLGQSADILHEISEAQLAIENGEHYDETKIKQYQEELKLNQDILALRSTSEDATFSFMSNKIPAAQNNPLNYFANWQQAWQTMEASAKSGYMDYTDFYNIVTEMGRMAEQSDAITVGAGTVLTNSKDAANLIEKAAQCLEVDDTGALSINLGKLADLGFQFDAAGEDMAAGVTAGIQEFAGAQVDMLDSMISLLETVVAMEKLGDIDVEGSTLKIQNLFETDAEGIAHYSKEYGEVVEYVTTAIEKGNKDLEKGLKETNFKSAEGIEFNLWDMFQMSPQDLANLANADENLGNLYAGVLSAYAKAAKSNDFSEENIWQSIKDVFAGTNLTGELDIGNLHLTLTDGVVLQRNEDNEYIIGDKTTTNVNEAVSYYKLEQLGEMSKAIEKGSGEIDGKTVDFTSELKVGTTTVQVFSSGKDVYYTDGTHTYSSLDQLINAQFETDNEINKQLTGKEREEALHKFKIDMGYEVDTTTTEEITAKLSDDSDPGAVKLLNDEPLEKEIQVNVTYGNKNKKFLEKYANESEVTTATTTTESVQRQTYQPNPKSFGMRVEETIQEIENQVQQQALAQASGEEVPLEPGQIDIDLNGNAQFDENSNSDLVSILTNNEPIIKKIQVTVEGDKEETKLLLTDSTGQVSMEFNPELANQPQYTIQQIQPMQQPTVTDMLAKGAAKGAAISTDIEVGENKVSLELEQNKELAQFGVTQDITNEDNQTYDALKTNESVAKPGVSEGINVAYNAVRKMLDDNVSYAKNNPVVQEIQQSNTSTSSDAKGTIGLARAAGTLMGELGPELVVSNGRYFVAGQHGPEMVNLADDAIVFNHLQTKSLLEKGTSSGRGKAITNERKAVAFAKGNIHGGPAKASASDALAALKQLRSEWQALANLSAKDLASKGGGGGGGGGKDVNFLKQLERWYNWLQEIAKLEEKINYEETLRSKIQSDFNKNGKDYYDSQKKSLKYLEREVQIQADLVKEQEAYFSQRKDELNKQSAFSELYTFDDEGQIKYLPGKFEQLSEMFGSDSVTGQANHTVKEQYDYLMSQGYGYAMQYQDDGSKIEIKDENDEENMKLALEAFWSKIDADQSEMQELHDSIEEHKIALLEEQQKQNEILKEMEDNQIQLENKVLKGIEAAAKREIDQMQKQKDAFEKSNKALIDGLSNALDKERSLYDNQQKEYDLDQKRRQLSILQRSGGSASEIHSLQKEIEDSSREMYFDKQQEQIDAIQEASDNQLEKLQEQIDIANETLEYQKENGLLWEQVYEVMNQSPEEIANFIRENDESYWGKSPTDLAQSMRDDLFEAEYWKAFAEEQATLTELLEGIAVQIGVDREKEKTEQEAADKASRAAATTEKHADTNNTSGGANNTQEQNTNQQGLLSSAAAAVSEFFKEIDKNAIATTSADVKGKFLSGFATSEDNSLQVSQEYIEKKKQIAFDMFNEALLKLTGGAATGGYIKNPSFGFLAEEGEEAVLTAEQTRVLKNDILSNNPNSLLNLLQDFRAAYTGLGSTTNTISNSSPIIIEHAEVNMKIDKLANSYDAAQAGQDVMREIVNIARKTNAQNRVGR